VVVVDAIGDISEVTKRIMDGLAVRSIAP